MFLLIIVPEEALISLSMQILALIVFFGLGIITMHFKLQPPGPHPITALNKFVFNWSLPALIVRALARQNLSEINFGIAGFFMILYLILTLFIGIYSKFIPNKTTIEKLSIFLLGFNGVVYVNAVIFGFPVAVAMFGEEGELYPILAAIPQLVIVTLPAIVVFEIRAALIEDLVHHKKTWDSTNQGNLADSLKQNTCLSAGSDLEHSTGTGTEAALSSMPLPKTTPSPSIDNLEKSDDLSHNLKVSSNSSAQSPPDLPPILTENEEPQETENTEQENTPHRPPMYKVLIDRLSKNPPMIAMVVGFLWIGFGIPYSVQLDKIFKPLGDSAPPIASMVIGMTTYINFVKTNAEGKKVVVIDKSKAFWMVSCSVLFLKMVINPLIAFIMTIIFDLSTQDAAGVVLVATMPVAVASFTFAKNYQPPKGVLDPESIAVKMTQHFTVQIVLGLFILLPALIVWLEITYAVHNTP